MALVNFYNQTPSDTQIATNLNDGELVVFTHTTSGERELTARVEALVAFNCYTHHENTVLPWNGPDYFVTVRSNFNYPEKREKLRAIAKKWVEADYPTQVEYI